MKTTQVFTLGLVTGSLLTFTGPPAKAQHSSGGTPPSVTEGQGTGSSGSGSSAQNPPTLEQQRAQDAQKTQEAQRASEAERQRQAAQADKRYVQDQPGELYVAGFGGYTIGHGFNNVEGTGALSGINLGDIDQKDSGVYGAKVGYFMPRRLNWLGVEMEAFNTTPHLQETAFTTGAHLRVTTLAFNAIARAKMMCERHDDYDRPGRSATVCHRSRLS